MNHILIELGSEEDKFTTVKIIKTMKSSRSLKSILSKFKHFRHYEIKEKYIEEIWLVENIKYDLYVRYDLTEIYKQIHDEMVETQNISGASLYLNPPTEEIFFEILCSLERSIKIESIHEFIDEKRENYTQIIDDKFYYFKKISKEIDTNLFDQLLSLS